MGPAARFSGPRPLILAPFLMASASIAVFPLLPGLRAELGLSTGALGLVTAATFFSCGLTFGGIVTPNRASMFLLPCTVNGAWLVWPPAPSRPTTRP